MASTTSQDKASGVPELAVPWKPSVGDSLSGVLINLDLMDSKYADGKQVLLLTIQDQSSRTWSYIPSSNAERQIQDRYLAGVIDIGKEISLTYVRDEMTKHGTMKRFVVLPEIPQDTLRKKFAEKFTKMMSERPSGQASLPLSEEEKLAEREADEARGKSADGIPF